MTAVCYSANHISDDLNQAYSIALVAHSVAAAVVVAAAEVDEL